MINLYFLSLFMYITPLAPGAQAPAGAVVIEVSPGFKGVVVADWSPGAVAINAPGGFGFHGPDKAACEKWGDEVRRTLAKDLKLVDYRQVKPFCTLRPVVY